MGSRPAAAPRPSATWGPETAEQVRARFDLESSFGRLLNLMENIGSGFGNGLHASRWPMDYSFFNACVLAQAEMEPAHVLRGIAVASGHFLNLLLPLGPGVVLPKYLHAGADGAAITFGPLQGEL